MEITKIFIATLVFVFFTAILSHPFSPTETYRINYKPSIYDLLGYLTAIAFSAFIAYVVYKSM